MSVVNQPGLLPEIKEFHAKSFSFDSYPGNASSFPSFEWITSFDRSPQRPGLDSTGKKVRV